MGFLTAIKTCFGKYATLSGRASRSEFWWFVLFLFLLGVVSVVLDAMLFGMETLDSDAGGPINIITNLATLLPSITVAVRRLHDTGKPGYYIFFPPAIILAGFFAGGFLADTFGSSAGLLAILAAVAGFGLYFWWYVKPSDPGENAYGPNPYDAWTDVEAVFE